MKYHKGWKELNKKEEPVWKLALVLLLGMLVFYGITIVGLVYNLY